MHAQVCMYERRITQLLSPLSRGPSAQPRLCNTIPAAFWTHSNTRVFTLALIAALESAAIPVTDADGTLTRTYDQRGVRAHA
jgi:hypothetical protein